MLPHREHIAHLKVKVKVFVYESVTRINLPPAKSDSSDAVIPSPGPITLSRAGTQFQTTWVNVRWRL